MPMVSSFCVVRSDNLLNQTEMSQEQFKEIADYLESKFTEADVKSMYIGMIYGFCEGDIQLVKETIDYFEKESKNLKG